MRYYVTADVHGFFSSLKNTLSKLGFFEDPLPHRLLICGDIFDRGEEALQMQDFLLELLEKDQLILVRGNHEDLAMELLQGWHMGSYLQSHHHSNGTIDTACQLTGFTFREVYTHSQQLCRDFLKTPFVQTLIPAAVDYYETEHYIFVHGWIPCSRHSMGSHLEKYVPVDNWRKASRKQWKEARWTNGMEAAHQGITVPGKTIVCGHWNCSFGHARYEQDGGEFDNNPNFDPYYGNGIIALDACTAFSKQVNCIIIND